MIVFKESTRFKTFSAPLAWMLDCLFRLEQNRPLCTPEAITITSVNDSTHSEGSRHYTDEAIDIRSHNFPDKLCKMTFVQLYQNMLNSHPHLPGCFYVFLEDEGKDNEHFHAQVKKGMRFDWV